MKTWQERLFELIRLADGFVACKGGTGTLVELAVVWEMLNKSVIEGKPCAVLGDFWTPVLDRVREVELGHPAPWGEANGRLVHVAASHADAVSHLVSKLGNNLMSRPAEEILEFDKLRELLRGRSTSAPGKRALDALKFSQDRERLERGFALIREAREWVRAGKELGLERFPIRRAGSRNSKGREPYWKRENFWTQRLFRDSVVAASTISEEDEKFPLLAARAESVIDFRDVLGLIRRAILPSGEISDDASRSYAKYAQIFGRRAIRFRNR